MHISRLSPAEIAADVAASLEALDDATIDLYWLHRDDPSIPVGEIMDALNEEVAARRLSALGASNWSPERIDAANTYAAEHGLIGFCGSQIGWSLAGADISNAPFGGTLTMDAPTLAYHRRIGFPVMAYSSQAAGFFVGKADRYREQPDTPPNGFSRTYVSANQLLPVGSRPHGGCPPRPHRQRRRARLSGGPVVPGLRAGGMQESGSTAIELRSGRSAAQPGGDRLSGGRHLSTQLNVALVGAVARGGSFAAAFAAHPATRIHAVCDVRGELLDEAKAKTGAAEAYTDYAEMLAKADIDAVVIGTPMQFHAPQAILALERGIHVLSEVTAGVSMDECRALAAAAAALPGRLHDGRELHLHEPQCAGAGAGATGPFGELYYAEGEYIHELKALNERTPWRRNWQTGINGVTYPTHSLGPILQWMAGDRVARICCEGSGHHYRDPRGDLYENQDSCLMLARRPAAR